MFALGFLGSSIFTIQTMLKTKGLFTIDVYNKWICVPKMLVYFNPVKISVMRIDFRSMGFKEFIIQLWKFLDLCFVLYFDALVTKTDKKYTC